MSERTYTTVDKSTWGDGPWQDEPDKVSWTHADTGYPCLIVRGPSGALCGYVGVAEGHPWFGVDYGNLPDYGPDVHGGLTYANACDDASSEATSICHIPEPGQPDDVWWFGFDCAHSGDISPGMEARARDLGMPPIRFGSESYRESTYVRAEVGNLALQIAAAA